MAPTDGKRLSRCGRGVLKLTSFKPCPRPGDLKKDQQMANAVPQDTQDLQAHSNSVTLGSRDVRFRNAGAVQTSAESSNRISAVNGSQKEKTEPKKDLQTVMAKYSYTANPKMPGGFEELTVKQRENVYYYHLHPQNPNWVKAENFDGKIGFVPANYLMELETKPTQLPWLEHRRLEKEAEVKKKQSSNEDVGFGVPASGTVKHPIKPYTSAYNTQGTAPVSEYSCDLCGKTLNGPQPYKLHMSSKAHKEEVEYRKQES